MNCLIGWTRRVQRQVFYGLIWSATGPHSHSLLRQIFGGNKSLLSMAKLWFIIKFWHFLGTFASLLISNLLKNREHKKFELTYIVAMSGDCFFLQPLLSPTYTYYYLLCRYTNCYVFDYPNGISWRGVRGDEELKLKSRVQKERFAECVGNFGHITWYSCCQKNVVRVPQNQTALKVVF